MAHAQYPGNVLHLVEVALAASFWASIARPAWWSERALRAAEVVVTIGSVALLGSTTLFTTEPIAHVVSALTFLAIVPARAIFVPSTGRRTLTISALAGTPVVLFTAMSRAPLDAVYVASWVGVGVVLSTVASWIIFGLTERVREAHQLGQYTLHDRLGGGGMGEVYIAQHAMLRRPTAIKLVRPETVGEATLKRFEREVRLTARLSHPNTVAIYDYGRTPDGIFYYAMELLDGVDLQRLVDRHGAMPPERVVHVLDQVCASLAEAHELGLIHRDVKPANIVLCKRGRSHDVVKVLDFGLVKDLRASEDVAVSKANTFAGTPLYLAPETIQAPDTIDARTDLYAIGLVGWFLLTGRPVFRGKNVVEVCGHHLHTMPQRPSEAGAKVEPDLEAVIMRCLEKKPAMRFPDADALREALLATSAAGKWTEAEAREWWKDHARGPSEATISAETTGVISIDLAARSVETVTAPERPARRIPPRRA